MFYGITKDAAVDCIYNLLGAEFSQYFLGCAIILFASKERRKINSWMLTRDCVFVLTLYLLLFFFIYLDGPDWPFILMFVMYFVIIFLDRVNERLMNSTY